MSEACSAACGDPLPPAGDYVKCVFGGCKLHYECSGLSEKTYRQMGQTRRDSYKCRLCRGGDTASSGGADSDNSESAQAKRSVENVTLNQLFAKLDSMEKNFKLTMESHTKDVQKTVEELKVSVVYCTEKIDDFVKEIGALSKRVKDAESEMVDLKRENNELRGQLSRVEVQLEELQQYGRKCNLQIDGVPEMNGERMADIINKLSIALDEPIVLNQDIQAAHRIPSSNKNRSRPVIIQFSNRQKRDAVLEKARKKKSLTTAVFYNNVPETPVFVNEHLTPYYKQLLYEAKTIKKEKKYEMLWVRGAKIFLKRNKDAPTIRIDSFSDLKKL